MTDRTDLWDLIHTEYQGLVKTHGPALCDGTPCCIHNPSDHHMRDWGLMFDPGKGDLAYRVCPHGIPHPDPDSLAYMARLLGADNVLYLALHTCEGCCTKEGFIGGH